ncbi:MAG: acyltransferase [Bacteroidia bacterium]|nr:acyltransferase [Bacteroidia bacterium]
MKRLLQHFIQKRNPTFHLDNSLTIGMIMAFSTGTAIKLLRGLVVLLRGRKPKGLMLGKRVSFRYLSRIRWGAFLKIGDSVELSGLGRIGIQIGNNVGIGSESKLISSTSLSHLGEGITIGNNVGIGEFAYLGGGGGLSIGDDCIIGQYFSCHPENHLYSDRESPIRLQGVERKGIQIGKNCWIGSKVSILDGVVLGDGCVVAAGAVVTKSFPENSILAGVPAKRIKSRVHESPKKNTTFLKSA